MARLGDVVRISASKKEIVDTEIWLLNLDMVEQQTGNIIEYNYVLKNQLSGSIIQFDSETVLYSKLRPNLNKVVVPNRDGFATSEMLPLKPNAKLLTKEFLATYLKSDNFVIWAISKTSGAKMPRLGTKELLDKDIPLPSLSQQRKIGSIFEKIDDLISLRKQQLSKLDELVQARFAEMFSGIFETASLNKVCAFIDYRGKTPEKSDFGIPLITAKNVRENSFSIEPQEFIPEENYEKVMTRGIPKVNDVLFTTEAPLGNVCRIPNIYRLFCVGQRIITMQPNAGIVTSEYLEYALRDKTFQDKMWEKSSGSTVKGIRSKLLEWLTIPVPPYGLQCSFSNFVQRTDRERLTIQQSLAKLEVLKKALMQKYFG